MDSHDNPAHDPARRALALMAQALDSLRNEYVEHGREELYELLKGFVSEQVSNAQIAAQLGMSEGAIRVAVCRFRHRLSQLIRKEAGKNPGDEGDAGSASLPVPKHPLTPHDSAGAEKIPGEDDHAA